VHTYSSAVSISKVLIMKDYLRTGTGPAMSRSGWLVQVSRSPSSWARDEASGWLSGVEVSRRLKASKSPIADGVHEC
jgi:hypothetical protein